MATSPSNKLLSAMYNADIKSPNGMGVGPILVRDTRGVTVFAGTQAWIQKMPKSTLGQSSETANGKSVWLSLMRSWIRLISQTIIIGDYHDIYDFIG